MLNFEEILNKLKTNNQLLKIYHVKKIGLFGSFSRNEGNDNSDIDFIVDFDKTSFDDFMDLSFKLEDLFKKKIDLLTENSVSPYMKPLIQNEIKWYETK
jgi:uncharacterized protein